MIRTDIAREIERPQFLLPRTDCVTTVVDALAFLQKTASTLWKDGVDTDKFCFIVHRFLASAACAQAVAWPEIPRVRVDSTWGLPDGLQYYAHDSFEVDPSRPETMRRQVRGKTEYLDVDATGRWIEKKAGSGWDWRCSLRDTDVLQLADATRRIAKHLKQPVDVMYFIGLDPSSGHPSWIPWYYTVDSIPDPNHEIVQFRLSGGRVIVTCPSDLESLRLRMPHLDSRRISIRVKPTPAFVRSVEFLKQVASLATKFQIPVELEGSILSHAYYILRREGVRVRCADGFDPETKQQEFGKLVRDLIPIRIVSHGEVARVSQVPRDKLITLLKTKAVEEALELLSAVGSDAMLEEMADLFEVIRTLCELTKQSFDEVQTLAIHKRDQRGGFDQGFILLTTEEVPLFRPHGEPEELLFEQGHESRSRGHIELSTLGSAALDATRVKMEDGWIILPLVPPASLMGRTLSAYDLRMDGPNVSVRYGDKEVAVRVRASADEDPDPAQLLLPYGT